jgi:preprotein translocase subunit SecD
MNLVVDRDKMQGKSEQEISDAADRAMEILRNRIDALGVSEPVLEREGTDGIVIQLPGLTDVKHARDIILSTAQLEFRFVSTLHPSDYMDKDGKIDVKKLPADITYFPGKDNQQYLCEKVLLTGEALVDAHVETDSLGRSEIAFTLNSEGGKEFGIITGENLHRQLAIILDDRVYSAPEIQSRIPGGHGVITGSFSDDGSGRSGIGLKSGSFTCSVKSCWSVSSGTELGRGLG